MYDFEKYYADMDVKAEVNIDLSGVKIENPQGNPNEHVTNNVVYYISGAWFSNSSNFSNRTVMGIDDRLMIKIDDDEKYFAAMYHPLADVLEANVTSEWEPGVEREDSVDLDEDVAEYTLIQDGEGGRETKFKYVRLFVFPRYEMICNNVNENLIGRVTQTNNAITANQNVLDGNSTESLPIAMKQIYGILGFYGKRKMSTKWMRKYSSKTKTNAVFGYDQFRKIMKFIGDCCAENNFGVDVKFYDQSYSEELPEGIEDATKDDYKKNKTKAKAKHNRYVRAVLNADITRTSMTKLTSFNDAYGKHLNAFLNNPKTRALIDNLVPAGDGVSAILPPIKDAVRGFFYPREDIETAFYDQFANIYDGLKVPLGILRRYLSGKLKGKLAAIGEKYHRIASDNNLLAFDLDSIIDILYKNPNQTVINCPASSDGNVIAFPRVFQINGKFETEPGCNSTWGCHSVESPNDSFNEVRQGIGSHWVNAGTSDYKDSSSSYLGNKVVVDMPAETVVTQLLEMYNWAIGLDDTDPIQQIDLVDSEGKDFFGNLGQVFRGGYGTAVNDQDSPKIKYFKWFVEMVGGWMNFFRQYDTKEKVWEFVDNNPFNSNETIESWLIRMVEAHLINGDWSLTGTYRVIQWDSSSNSAAGCRKWKNFVALIEEEWGIDPTSEEDIDVAVQMADVMIGAYKNMKSILVSMAFTMNPVKLAQCWDALEDVADDISDFTETLDRIKWYQALVNESVFTNKSMYGSLSDWLVMRNGLDEDDNLALRFVPWMLPARFMVPVAMYKKVRRKYKRWGRTRHKTVKVYSGVRWAEVRFYDLNVFGEYPQVEETPGNTVQLGKPATIEQVDGQWIVNFDEALPEDIWNAASGELQFSDVSKTTLQVEFDNEMSAHVPNDVDPPTLVGEHVVVSVKVPPERSRNDTENKTPVTVHLKAPALPYDEEIRKQAFVEYGPFSQDKLFEVVRYGDGGFPNVPEDKRFDGWKIFRPTSRKIEDMREGFGLYDKVAFLMSILTHEFGSGRVELINTWRSADDQKGICTGGPESSMLSWHNYGMAAKILIYQADGTTPIEDKSDDMKHLVKVARAFTKICGDGRLGAPCNVVWCGRLTINPSLFDWEFLPIGVGHKDAFKFREAIMAQRDPIRECAYVDVDAAKLVRGTAPSGNIPYILNTSSAYKNAIVINGHHFVSPDRIMNYSTPEDIVLYDLVEYIDLINLKMNANGNKLGDRRNMYEWKSLNDSACTQLIRYFALTNNIKSAKALIAGDFVEKYQAVEDAYYSSSVIDYVKNMLGSHYEDVYVTIDSLNDAGFISLSNGKMYIKVHDLIPDNVPTMIDMHGQQRVDNKHIKRGVWRDGIFYGLDEIEIPYTESDGPVIEGYVDGQASFGEAMFLHQAVASELHAAFLKIRDLFERYKGAVMYDRFRDGPNADKFSQLENEFGAIAAQDLMDFDELEALLAQDDINKLADIETNGERNGITDEDGNVSIYEKVVNNAQLAGMRKAVKTSERMHITDKGNGLTPGEIYRAVMEGRAPGANDLMSRR